MSVIYFSKNQENLINTNTNLTKNRGGKNTYVIVYKETNVMQITKSLTSFSVGILGGTVFSFVSADIAQAVTFTFDDDDNGLSTIVKTVDGITLTLSNPSPRSDFEADSDGLVTLGSFGSDVNSLIGFDLTFSSPVQLVSYTVGFVGFGLDGDETLTLSDEISTSVENSSFSTGLRNFSNQFTVAAGQTITVTNTNVDGNDILQWSAIEVTPVEEPTSVPEPGSMLGLLALGGLGAKSAFKKLKK